MPQSEITRKDNLGCGQKMTYYFFPLSLCVFAFLFLLNVLNLISRSLISKKLIWASDDPSHRIKIENGLSHRQCHGISRFHGLYRSIGYIRSLITSAMVKLSLWFTKTRWPTTLNLKFKSFKMVWNRHFRLLKMNTINMRLKLILNVKKVSLRFCLKWHFISILTYQKTFTIFNDKKHDFQGRKIVLHDRCTKNFTFLLNSL